MVSRIGGVVLFVGLSLLFFYYKKNAAPKYTQEKWPKVKEKIIEKIEHLFSPSDEYYKLFRKYVSSNQSKTDLKRYLISGSTPSDIEFAKAYFRYQQGHGCQEVI